MNTEPENKTETNPTKIECWAKVQEVMSWNDALRAKFLYDQVMALVGVILPEGGLKCLRAAIAVERQQEEPMVKEAAEHRAAVVEMSNAFLLACEQKFLPIIEKHAHIFKSELDVPAEASQSASNIIPANIIPSHSRHSNN